MASASDTTVIAGTGVAGLEAALALREALGPRAPITLLGPEDAFHHRALGVGEAFGLGRPRRHPIAPLAADLGLQRLPDALLSVDAGAHRLRLASGSALDYARLVVAVGAPLRPAGADGILFDRARNAAQFDAVVADLEAGAVAGVEFSIGEGVSWPLPAYELALMTAAWGAAARPGGVAVSVRSTEPAPLDLFGPAASAAVSRALGQAGVSFGPGPAPADRVIVLPELDGPHVDGLPADAAGFVAVDPWGRVPGADDVYAIGDAAAHPIKQGGLAAQQAAEAARAIAFDAGLRTHCPPPRPVLRGLLRTVDGPLYLRAVLGDATASSTAAHEPLWWPPSKLAAPRLTSYLSRVERSRLEGRVLPSGGVVQDAP
ncbi:MAG: FAD-dependent oxidoreductase [Solirubrobacteraceae bacterium]